MQSTKSQEVLKKITKHKGVSYNELSRKIGFKNNTIIYHIKNGRNGISEEVANKIHTLYPEFNYDWIRTGDGKMLKDVSNNATQNLIPLYDVEAIGGADHADTTAVTQPTRMINIGDFLKDSEAAIRVYGNSMLPGYPSGCVIGTRLITGSVIEWGEVYVIETREARYIKRLYKGGEKKITCYSDNTKEYTEGPRKGKPLYEPFDVPTDDIIRYHRAVGVIKRNDNSVV